MADNSQNVGMLNALGYLFVSIAHPKSYYHDKMWTTNIPKYFVWGLLNMSDFVVFQIYWANILL